LISYKQVCQNPGRQPMKTETYCSYS